MGRPMVGRRPARISRRLVERTAALAAAVTLVLGAPLTPDALLPGALQAPAAAATLAPAELTEPLIEGIPDGWPRSLGTEASAYVVLDADSGQLLAGRDHTVRRPVASTVKVLTAYTALQRVDLDDEVTAGEEVLDVPGSGVGLAPGETWSVEELIDALIARSGNEAAEALAVHVAGSTEAFLRLMEEDAAALGRPGLELVSVSGLDDDNRLSAVDLAVISRAALAHEELRPALARTAVTLPSEGDVETRNELLDRYEGATGVKTGFTSAAGNSLIGSAVRDGREVVAVVLDAGDDPARFEQAAALLDLGFERFEERDLGASLVYAVAGGSVTLSVDDLEVVVPSDHEASLNLPVAVRPPEVAGTAELVVDGAELAEITATIDREEPDTSPRGASGIGHAAADGVYAALRARAANQGFGS